MKDEDPPPERRLPRLSPRNALFGGRTGATCLHRVIDKQQGEQIRHIDVTSEYPWVYKQGTYPTGHPQIFFQPQDQNILLTSAWLKLPFYPQRIYSIPSCLLDIRENFYFLSAALMLKRRLKNPCWIVHMFAHILRDSAL